MKIVKYILGLFIIVSIVTAFVIESSAKESNSITITKTINSTGGESGKKVDGIIYGLLRVSTETTPTDEKKNDLIKRLSSKSIDELTKAYDKFGELIVSSPTDSGGKTIVTNLKSGTYFITEIKKENDKWIMDRSGVPLVVSVFSNTNVNVNSKSYTPDQGDRGKEYKNIVVRKTWVGKKLSKIQIHLYANNEKKDEIELNESNGWAHEFKNLPKYDTNKKLIIYTVKEVVPDGYTSKLESKNDNSEFIVTNIENGEEGGIKKFYKDGARGGSSGGSDSGKSIIKTGDWTIYPIVGTGVFLMAFGYRVYRKY